MGRDNRDLQKNKKKRELAVIKVQDQNRIIIESRKKNKIRKTKEKEKLQKNKQKRQMKNWKVQTTEKKNRIIITKHTYMQKR